jgi:hypothetical protein
MADLTILHSFKKQTVVEITPSLMEISLMEMVAKKDQIHQKSHKNQITKRFLKKSVRSAVWI